MAAPHTTLTEMAGKINELANNIDGYMKEKELRAPTFAADSVESYPEALELQGVRMSLIETLTEMLHLAISPSEYLLWHSLTVCGLFIPKVVAQD
jgi:hypothetical protein